MEIKEGELLTIGEVIRLGLANKCEIAIYGSEKEETASNDTEGEKSLESITSMNGGKVKYRVKSFDDAEKILSVIREVTWA
ncbi:hypothetical protein C5S35_11840 [Candidatus Methanophagaceae archaeon]|jgi:hypothetical protein|nr:MAG: hypothetical protein C5S38_09915 [Methanophagales archaeon]KAF5435173.1 hypothetical protein C5S35_11840 [Methanophagales archaeon]KAF5436101.1 hypothetical protein C5S36_01435 [Methanophagales archaeon]